GQPASAGESDDLRRVLDDELRNVPEKYRVPLLLCYLEGRTQAEAADQLGWTPGTLRGRLDRGRALLQNRLRRRGLGTGGPRGALGSPEALEAEPLQISRILSPALHDGAPGVSDRVRELAEGALWAMMKSKLQIVAMVIATLALVVGLSSLGLLSGAPAST